jgi:phosphoglucosamine mutase
MGGRFGTDGIRGPVGTDLNAPLALGLGRAVGHLLGGTGRSVLIGRDTRRSGEMLSAALAAGLTATGTDVTDLSIVTTPCLVHASIDDRYAAGIMVSASHNPAEDNGLKVVAGGRKVDDAVEAELDGLIDDASAIRERPNGELGRMRTDTAAVEGYWRHLADIAGDAFRDLRIGIDCANGSASVIAPDLFRSLGAEVTVLFDAPNGVNINDRCGSTHPERLAETVGAAGLDIGFAFDGDADRLIAVDERGGLVDGDAVMGICALERLAAGTLRNNVLVATVMSNGGLERIIREAGGRVVRTPVGDRNVYEAMERDDAVLGGEQSGHIICLDGHVTGDGLAAALLLCRALEGRSLAEAAAVMPKFAQVKENIPARVTQLPQELQHEIERMNEELDGIARILVRASGTEPLVRVLAEAPAEEEAARLCGTISALVRRELG